MTFIEAIVLGVVEGITEFLPISSTAHLIITSKLLDLPQNGFVSFFEVFIQSGAILAVVLLYWKLVLDNKDYITKVLISFIPTAIVGFFMRDIIKDIFFQSTNIISASLVTFGLIFIFIEYLVAKRYLILKKTMKKMTYTEAFLIGLIQSLAIVPGVSRAGAVIIGMMVMRYKRSEAAIYSFLLAVPTIIGASIFDLAKTDLAVLTPINIASIALGFIVSFVSALIFIRWLISYLQKETMVGFGIYRIILGLGAGFLL